jgi:hypothetical protein
MSNHNERVQEKVNELHSHSVDNKILFLQILLSHFTITARQSGRTMKQAKKQNWKHSKG